MTPARFTGSRDASILLLLRQSISTTSNRQLSASIDSLIVGEGLAVIMHDRRDSDEGPYVDRLSQRMRSKEFTRLYHTYQISIRRGEVQALFPTQDRTRRQPA